MKNGFLVNGLQREWNWEVTIESLLADELRRQVLAPQACNALRVGRLA
jgi:hypothetical protein